MNKLKEIRTKKKISQEMLACNVGVTVNKLRSLKAETENHRLDVAFKIAKVLNSTVDDIFLPRKCTKCSQE